MERMKRVARAMLLAAAALVLMALSTTCQDPTGLIRSVEVSVMSANDKFLRIVSLTPANQSQNVSSVQVVTIQFDRSINESTIPGNLTVKRADSGAAFTAWDWDYDGSTRTLKLTVSQPLAPSTSYTVTLSRSLLGTDGSQLMQQNDFSFTTADTPSAFFSYGPDPLNSLKYVNASVANPVSIKITVQAESLANLAYRLTDNESDLDTGVYLPVNSSSFTALNLSFSDGSYTYYLRLIDNDKHTVMSDYNSTIIVDRTFPTIAFDTSNSDVIAYEKVYWKWTVTDPGASASGLASWYYRRDGGNWYGTSGTTYTYTRSDRTRGPLPVSGNSYLLELYAVDKAGNSTLSSPAGHTIDLSSVEAILPKPNAPLVSTTPTVDWPDYPNASFYLVSAGTGSGHYNLVSNGYTTASGASMLPTLALGTTYYWYYKACHGKSLEKYEVLYTSREFQFTTIGTKF